MTWFHRSVCVAVFAALLFPSYDSAQTPATSPFAFELAAIRPSRPANPNSNFNLNGGRVSTENIPLLYLLKLAFGLNIGSDDQVVGAPAWVRTTGFDITTKIDDATAKTLQAMSPEEQEGAIDAMVRKLLEDRFHLKAHTELQPRTVDALVLAKGGSRLQLSIVCDAASADHPCPPPDGPSLHNDGHGHVEGKGATTAMLANILATQPDIGGRMVVDNTGLAGKYNFDLHYTPDSAAGENSGPSLFSALGEQLGLKLETKRLPIKVLIIDQVNQPTPN